MMIELNKIYNGDCLETLKTFDDESVDCVITSPPYWQLRDYGWNGQWGLEKTYQEYLGHLWMMMDEIWRVLKDTGTVWINLGDSFNGSGGCHTENHKNDAGFQGKLDPLKGGKGANQKDLPSKCLMLIPHRFAIGCIDRGWILRNDIIWAKRNGMPESVGDRFSKKHEFIFFFVKQQKYYFDLDGVKDKTITKDNSLRDRDNTKLNNTPGRSRMAGLKENNFDYRNPGSVSDFWDITTRPSTEKHFATYNFDLIDKPIIAGCPEGGIVLDPFAGTGTTLLRAIDLRRKGIGIEGKKEYCEIFEDRFFQRYGMMKEII